MPLPSQVHQPTAIGNERDFHIVQRDGKWCLLAKSSGKTLGCHDTKEGAEAQERAVQANKHSEITVAQMREICPSCAEKMEKKRIKSLKLDFTKDFAGLTPQALAGLCEKFGEPEGFRTRCMDSEIDVSDTGAFCNWLKDKCHGTVKDHSLAETMDIEGVEIFASGTWNGDKYTNKDLDQLVDAFEQTKEYLKPYLKLGHSDEQTLLAEDELPAAGWVTNIYRKGSKLLADFAKMPQKIYDLVKSGAYARVSSEIFINLDVNGKMYPKALKAVALLGGETPAVQTLDDIRALYCVESSVRAYEKEAEVRAYQFDSARKEGTMPEEKDMLGRPTPAQAAVASGASPAISHAAPAAPAAPESHKEPDGDECYTKLAQATKDMEDMRQKLAGYEPAQKSMEEQVAGYKARNQALSKELAEVKEHAQKADEELKKFKSEAHSKEIKSRVESLVNDKKIVPSQVPLLETLLTHASEAGVKKFKVGEKEIESAEALILEFISNGAGSGLPTEPKSENGMAASVDPQNGDSVHQATLKYMADNKVSNYTEAYKAVRRALDTPQK